MGYNVSENQWIKRGWYNIPYGKCAYFTEYSNGMFYYYAFRGRDYWGGNFGVCVDPTSFFTEIAWSVSCARPFMVVNFQAEFVSHNGAIFDLD